MNDSIASSLPLAVHTCGEGPPLVLFHGGMGSWNHWTRNFDALASRFTVHAVDLPGYGDSPRIAKSTPEDRYLDVVIEGLQPIVGAQAFSLVGFSFGGVTAAMTAARLGARVRKLSLIGVGGFGPIKKLELRPIPPESAGAAARREVFRYNLGVLMLAQPSSVTEESIDFYDANFRRTRFDGREFSRSMSVHDTLSRIEAEVQIIYGEHDPLVRGAMQQRIDTVHAVRPDARFDVVAGSGHWAQYEAAERVNRLLLEFLAA